jgi:hypothetical protein
MTLRYLLDEHIPRSLIHALRQRAADVTIWRIGQPGAPPLETPDAEILLWCEAHAFVLVTNNRATMPAHLAAHLDSGRHVPGIFIVDTRMSVSAIAEELWLAALFSLADEYRDQMRYLPLA